MFQTSYSQSSFCPRLLGLLSFILLFSCDPVKATLASDEAKSTFGYWVWQKDHFLSVASLQGLSQLKEQTTLFGFDEEVETFLVSNSRDRCLLWSCGNKRLYNFTAWNPSNIKEVRSETLDLILHDKKILEIFLFGEEYVFVLAPFPKKEYCQLPCGVRLVFLNSHNWQVKPKILPFQLKYPDAQLLTVQSVKEGFLVFWLLEKERIIMIYDQNWEEEKQLSESDLPLVCATHTLSSLRGALRNFWLTIVEREALGNFIVKVKNDQNGSISLFEYVRSEEPVVTFSGCENEKYLAVLRGNRLYCFNKQLACTWEVLLPFEGTMKYENLILSANSFLLNWRLPAGAHKVILGLIEVPYAR